MLELLLGVILGVAVTLIGPQALPMRFRTRPINNLMRVIGIVIIVTSVASSSFVYVPDGHLGQLFRVYGGGRLPAGKIVAVKGENGPQAAILTPGFQPWLLINVLYNVDTSNIEERVEPGKVAVLVAKDGAPLRPGQAFADPFPPNSPIRCSTPRRF